MSVLEYFRELELKEVGERKYKRIEVGKKSIAYKLVFKDSTRTLSDEEVMEVFNKIIKEVEEKTSAKLRN